MNKKLEDGKKWLHFNIVNQNTYLQNKFVRFHLRIEKNYVSGC